MSDIHFHNPLRKRLALSLIVGVLQAIFSPLFITSNARGYSPGPPQGEMNFVRQIPLTTNDAVYSAATGKIYASVPSTVGPNGNSIATIDPTTGVISNYSFIGSEPSVLALADDGQTLYASLDGAFSLRRFNIQSETAGQQFSVGQDSFFGRYSVNDLVVAPGDPDVVAIARHRPGVSPTQGGVAVFDNGVQRPNTGPDHIQGSDFLAYSATADKLYGAGFSSNLKTMAIDSNGVTVTSTTSFSVGARIKFHNGLIFSSLGRVVNPDTSTQLGTFANVVTNAFVADSTVGRAYYVVGGDFGNDQLVLRAFDINTFLQVGSFTIQGATGTPTSLLRWGANGLVLRTTTGLFVIQTSLIPSAEPVPTPTPTPSPVPSPSPASFDSFVRLVPLPSNDLVYDQPTQKLYASVPSSAGSRGNTITPVDPVTATVGTSVFVGSEPTKLAQADDGQTLYVDLEGAGAVRRFNTATQTAGQQFSIGLDNFFGVYTLSDIAVAPGNPGLIAVARQYRGVSPSQAGVAIFDNGVRRPNVGPGHIDGSFNLTFSNSASTLYGAGSFQGLAVMTIDVSGIAANTYQRFSSGNDVQYVNGLLYGSSGQVINPATGALVGTFSGMGFGNFPPLMAVDAANGRVFFLTGQGASAQLRAYDINTFLPIGSVTLNGVLGSSVSSLLRWGTNGLAFRNENSIVLVQTSLVNSSDPVPTPTPTPSPMPSPSPPYIPTFIRRVNQAANSLVHSSANQSLYVSVPSTAAANGNSITRIVPETGLVGPSVFVGSEPNRLAISDNGQTIYVKLDGANAIRRFEVATGSPGTQFQAGTSQPADMEVLPGNPNAVAVSRGGIAPVVIYDDGVARTNTGNSFHSVGPIEFANSATLYGVDNLSSASDLVKYSVDASGVNFVAAVSGLSLGSGGLKFANGLLYTGSRIADPITNTLVGSFRGSQFPNAIAIDVANSRAFLASGSGSSVVLTAFDINTFVPVGSVTIPGATGIPFNLVRWGTNGLAFNTQQGFGPPGSPDTSSVYILQTELVSSTGTIPTGLQFNASTHSAFEGFPGSVAVAVSRTGSISGTTTVNYSTSNGSATAGEDYTAVSGTLTFAAGELTKTINVPILNDTIFENGTESFNVNLSNASSGGSITLANTTVTISDDDPQPSLSTANTVTISEGNSGTKQLTFTLTLSNQSVQTATVDYIAAATGTASAGSDFVATSGTLTFQPGTINQTVNVVINGDTTIESDETFTLSLGNATNINFLFTNLVTATIVNDDASVQLGGTSTFAEASNSASIPVTRTGATNIPFSVDYLTADGSASQVSDYTTASGTLHFAAGELTKNITVLIADDAHVEGTETFTVTLSSPSGVQLGTPVSATLSITDNDSSPTATNPIDTPGFFVRQHYSDFLNRVPDQGGLDYWTGQLTVCGPDPVCMLQRRVGVSAAYFVENEFQRTGYVVYRMHRAAFGTFPGGPQRANLLYSRFMIDRGQLFDGPGLQQSTTDFANVFVARPEFIQGYPTSFTNAQFVNKLFDTAELIPFTTERQQQIDAMNNAGKTRAQVLLDVIEIAAFKNREYNRAFVLMQYFGYLRRDTDQSGYDFWLNILNNQAPNNYRAMVCAFLTSAEYQQRFGTSVTRTNQDCAQ